MLLYDAVVSNFCAVWQRILDFSFLYETFQYLSKRYPITTDLRFAIQLIKGYPTGFIFQNFQNTLANGNTYD